MEDRNIEIKNMYKKGFTQKYIADYYNLSYQRIQQIIDPDSLIKKKGIFRLSPREKEITKLLSDGFSDKEMSKKLDISARTIQTHVVKILLKLNANNRTNAVAIALKEGLILEEVCDGILR